MVLFGDKSVVVTMLGSIGSGKTCYISSMFSKITHGRELSGYYLNTNKHDDSIKLLSMWEKIVRGREAGAERFPEATQTIDEYSFTMKYGLHEPIIMFDWLDYGGGAVPASNDDPDRQKLLKRLKDTDCLILCVSGQHLKEPITDENREEVLLNIDAHFINSLIGEVQRSGRNTPPSIAIIVTQYDRCQKREATIFEDIKQIFPILFESKGWLVMICPVTLGLGLVDNLSAPVNPINVHIPIVFSLLSKMIRVQWEKIDQSQLNVKKGNKQDIATIREIFRSLESGQSNIYGYNHSELAKKLKQEIIRMSSVIVKQKLNAVRFITYLHGNPIAWKDLLGEDINLD